MGARKRPDPRVALAKACAALKIFPLPGVVVLPGTPAPFHVFEPRYRALVAAALEGDRMLAVPTLVRDEDAPMSHAAVHPVAGAGFIEAEEKLPDGRYHVLLRGVARVRLVEEVDTGEPWRAFRAEILEDVYPAGGPGALEAEVKTVEQLVLELSQLLPPESGAPRLAEAVTRVEDPGALADLVAAATVSEQAGRLRILEELDVAKRLRLVEQEIAGVVLMLSQGKTPSA